MGVKKGQVFILTALIFASLLLLVSFSIDRTPDQSESNLKDYFSSSKDNHVKSFNYALKQNYTMEYVKKKLYNTNRFMQRRTRSKGIEFDSVQVVMLPEYQRMSIINYRDSRLKGEINVSGGTKQVSLGPKQSTDLEMNTSTANIGFNNTGIDKKLFIQSPRLLNLIQMQSDRENWKDITIH